jgi:DUF438 domain-containing protein
VRLARRRRKTPVDPAACDLASLLLSLPLVSELIENGALGRKDLLKHLILQLHVGAAPDAVRTQLVRLLGQVPYGVVVEAEQELIEDGMPPEEVTRLCHLHTAALSGAIDLSAEKEAPPGHPVHTFRRENAALGRELDLLEHACRKVAALPAGADASDALHAARVRLNAVADVDKHYLRKENLLFPFLEKHGVTGPPKVMWAKHDEARAAVKLAVDAIARAPRAAGPALAAVLDRAVRPAVEHVRGMIEREESILLPMSLDTLTEEEWWEVARGEEDWGWCLVEPETGWRPPAAGATAQAPSAGGRIRLPTGGFDVAQLEAILNALPLDATFVDADDRVRYFTSGKDRVFTRSRAVLGRKVQFCHPPSSVDTVDRILEAFRAGTKDEAAFWIQLRGRFVHISYRALRGAGGEYLGCLEVTEDLTEKRALTGEQRLLSWEAPPAPLPQLAAAVCPGHAETHGSPEIAAAPAGERPGWTAPAPARALDARPLLAQGVHPVEQVMREVTSLAPGEVFLLTTPFPPAPLVQRAEAAGFEAHVAAESPAVVRTWFRRRPV